MNKINYIELNDKIVFEVIPERSDISNKGSFGKLLNISGSYCMSGAAVLSSLAAYRCGVGLVSVACPQSAVTLIASGIREATFLTFPEIEGRTDAASASKLIKEKIGRFSACLVGCGMGNTPETENIVSCIIKNASCPVIIDADGINSICGCADVLKEANSQIILTPHLKEASRLMQVKIDTLFENKIKFSQKFVSKYNVTLVLKDSHTLIFDPSGEIYSLDYANSGLSKGGSGDVLSGIIASFAAQGLPALKAACCGVWLHSEAGRRCAEQLSKTSMLPSDIINKLSEIFKENSR